MTKALHLHDNKAPTRIELVDDSSVLIQGG